MIRLSHDDSCAAGVGRRWVAVVVFAAAYFASVFSAGFALGVPRTLWLAPAVGELAAVAIELPLMLGLSWLICTRLLRRWPLAAAPAALAGALALALLLAAEAGLSLLAGRSLDQHLALYAQGPHQLGLVGQLGFAVIPWLQTWRAARRALTQ